MKNEFKKITRKYYLLLSASIVLYTAFIYLILNQLNYNNISIRNKENEVVYEVFGTLILVCGVIYSYINYKSTFIGVNDESVKDLLKKYTKAVYIRISTLTTLGIYTLVACFATENLLFILPLAVILIMQAKSHPAYNKFIEIYQLNDDKINTLENNFMD